MRRAGLTAVLVFIGMILPAVPAASAEGEGPEAVGLFDPRTSTWYLRDAGGSMVAFEFGTEGVVPVAGDWDGDGFDSPGVYDPGSGTLLVIDAPGDAPAVAALPPGGIPVAGDPDGDGRDSVGVIVHGIASSPWAGTEVPEGVTAAVAADLDGDGRDELVMRGAEGWATANGPAPFPAITAGERAVAGDWDGDGVATLAVFRSERAEIWLYGGASASAGVTIQPMGSSRMHPVAGRFGQIEGRAEFPPSGIDIPPLRRGEAGVDVVRLQAELARRGLFRGEIDGDYGVRTAYAVMAFHKTLGMDRTWDWQEGDDERLEGFEPSGYPHRPDEPDRIEVDMGRQVMFVILDHEVEAILPVSTGGGYTYYSKRAERNVTASTPRGDFELIRYSRGWSCDPLYGWCIYKPWNFTSVYAIHGYNSVPAYPASHGCVRIPNWDADAMESVFYIGMPVHVWSEMPVVPVRGPVLMPPPAV